MMPSLDVIRLREENDKLEELLRLREENRRLEAEEISATAFKDIGVPPAASTEVPVQLGLEPKTKPPVITPPTERPTIGAQPPEKELGRTRLVITPEQALGDEIQKALEVGVRRTYGLGLLPETEEEKQAAFELPGATTVGEFVGMAPVPGALEGGIAVVKKGIGLSRKVVGNLVESYIKASLPKLRETAFQNLIVELRKANPNVPELKVRDYISQLSANLSQRTKAEAPLQIEEAIGVSGAREGIAPTFQAGGLPKPTPAPTVEEYRNIAAQPRLRQAISQQPGEEAIQLGPTPEDLSKLQERFAEKSLDQAARAKPEMGILSEGKLPEPVELTIRGEMGPTPAPKPARTISENDDFFVDPPGIGRHTRGFDYIEGKSAKAQKAEASGYRSSNNIASYLKTKEGVLRFATVKDVESALGSPLEWHHVGERMQRVNYYSKTDLLDPELVGKIKSKIIRRHWEKYIKFPEASDADKGAAVVHQRIDALNGVARKDGKSFLELSEDNPDRAWEVFRQVTGKKAMGKEAGDIAEGIARAPKAIDAFLKSAAATQKALMNELKDVTDDIPNTIVLGALKSKESILQKIERKRRLGQHDYSVQDMSDVVRGAIAVPTAADLSRGRQWLLDHGYVESVDYGQPALGGYRKLHFDKVSPEGIKMEAQLHTVDSWNMKLTSDEIFYRKWRGKEGTTLSLEEQKEFFNDQMKVIGEWENTYKDWGGSGIFERSSAVAITPSSQPVGSVETLIQRPFLKTEKEALSKKLPSGEPGGRETIETLGTETSTVGIRPGITDVNKNLEIPAGEISPPTTTQSVRMTSGHDIDMATIKRQGIVKPPDPEQVTMGLTGTRRMQAGMVGITSTSASEADDDIDPTLKKALQLVGVSGLAMGLVTPTYLKNIQRLIKSGHKNSPIYKQVVKWQKVIESEPAFLKFNPNTKFIQGNAEYAFSIDPDYLCQRSWGTDLAIRYLKKKLGQQYNKEVALTLLAKANAANLPTACKQCYVWWHRIGKEGSPLAKPIYFGVAGYDGALMRMKESTIGEIIEKSLRGYSSTDFKAEHIPGLLASSTEAAELGLPQGFYTKEADLAEILGPAGAHINISVGRDETVGSNMARALAMKKKHPNVGLVYIAFTDDEVRMALRDPRFDHVIPWHSSGAKKDEMIALLGDPDVVNYTEFQRESRLINGKKTFVGDDLAVKDIEHAGNKEKYLAICDEREITPKFPQFIDEDNYMKLIGPEYGKFGGAFPYEPMTTNFGFDAIPQAIRNRKVQTRASAQPYMEIAADIVQEVTGKRPVTSVSMELGAFGTVAPLRGLARALKTEGRVEGINIGLLNIPQGDKEFLVDVIEDISPELQKVVGKPLTHDEVIEAAKTSEMLKGMVSRGETKKREVAALALRQHIAALSGGTMLSGEQGRELINALGLLRTYASTTGRELNAFKIGADPNLNTIKIQLLKKLTDLGHTADEILDAAKGVDFTNSNQVTAFYRKFVPPTFMEMLDEYRYINVLSGSRTHIVNAFSNLIQGFALRPGDRLASGVIDIVASGLAGMDRQIYMKEVPAYYRGFFSSTGEGLKGAFDALRGKTRMARPDVGRMPTGAKVLRPFVVIPRAMEAMDVLFRTMIKGGEREGLALRYRKMGKTISDAQLDKEAEAIAAKYVFRDPIDPTNVTGQGSLLSFIDKGTSMIYRLREIPLGKVKPFQWFLLFVQTPMSILKQGLEHSPAGILTLPGAANKVEQLGKAMVGSTVFAGAGYMAMTGRTTWAAPKGEKERAAFYAAGKQPHSLRIGDEWYSYSKLGPLAYPIAMAAAWAYYANEQPKAMTDNDYQKATRIFIGIAEFFSDQSYVEGIGSIVDVASGAPGGAAKAISELPSQIVPLSSLLRWTENLTDPFYRKAEKGLSPEAIIENIQKGIPVWGKELPTYETPTGGPSERQNRLINAFSPVQVTTAKPEGEKILSDVQLAQKYRAQRNMLYSKIAEAIDDKKPERAGRYAVNIYEIGATWPDIRQSLLRRGYTNAEVETTRVYWRRQLNNLQMSPEWPEIEKRRQERLEALRKIKENEETMKETTP